MKDRFFLKRLWDMATPWIQITGFIIMCSFIVGTYFSEFRAYGHSLDAHENRLEILEHNYTEINQKLDDIKNFLITPQRRVR